LTETLVTMSKQELSRLEVLEQILSKRLTQQAGAEQLGLSKRQVHRLVKAYKSKGTQSLLSTRRGKRSNRSHTSAFKQKVLEAIQANYVDFGPTLASEKLRERENLSVNKETVRQWMIEAGFCNVKQRSSKSVHQQRARRASFGELVQIDGSPHAWFEERGPKCCLLVFIDDATSRLLQLYFCEVETTNAYFNATQSYIKKWGRPASFCSDRHSIFRVNTPEAKKVLGKRNLDVRCAN
jgi:transposase